MTQARILIAGVGNIFRGDDAFGVEVVRRLAGRTLPASVRVADFGIRGHDLAYAILEEYDAVILVDAVERGGEPGTVYTLQLNLNEAAGPDNSVGGHGIELPAVFQLVQALGGSDSPICLVGCEPAELGSEYEGAMGLSAPVAAAIHQAIERVELLAANMLAGCNHA